MTDLELRCVRSRHTRVTIRTDVAHQVRQRETPPHLMGRIGATSMSVIFVGQLLGLVLSGMLAQRIGVRDVFFLCARLGLVLTGAGKWLRGTERRAAT